MNGWSSRELRLNEENKALVRTQIITIDIGDKNKKVGVQIAWAEGRDRKRQPWPRESKRMMARERKSDGQGERESN